MKTAMRAMMVAGVVMGLWCSSSHARPIQDPLDGIGIIDAVGGFGAFNLHPSDLNMDGVFNSQDLWILFVAVKSTSLDPNFDIRADLNGDMNANEQDVQIFMQNKECLVGSPAWDPRLDLDGDGNIAWFDMFIIANNTDVPEPATLSLLVLGGLAMVRRRK